MWRDMRFHTLAYCRTMKINFLSFFASTFVCSSFFCFVTIVWLCEWKNQIFLFSFLSSTSSSSSAALLLQSLSLVISEWKNWRRKKNRTKMFISSFRYFSMEFLLYFSQVFSFASMKKSKNNEENAKERKCVYVCVREIEREWTKWKSKCEKFQKCFYCRWIIPTKYYL